MNFPARIPTDPASVPTPAPCFAMDPESFAAEQESLRRAMPIQRLLSGGMCYADATAMHAAGHAGVGWTDCGEWLGERDLRLACGAPSAHTARSWFRFASACFRFAQSAIPRDTDRKRNIYRKMVNSFGAACALDVPITEKHEISWRSGKLCGWLMRPANIASPPVVILMGGFDGWREEYHAGAVQLVERGVAAFLIDGPGQGETRLFHHSYLDADFPDAFATAAVHLREHCALDPRVGIWGNSLGGFLAAKTVATHPHVFNALCVNGGTMHPLELPKRYPRFFEKVEALMGSTDRARAMECLQGLDVSRDVTAIRCPLLQLHSVPDQVFLLENARPIHDHAASPDKTFLLWEDGDHCIYNHFEEKNMVVADWFAQRLVNPRG
jgi:alpha-beta hydrolase superfamily lysophospholipase